jgi:hypothetical protein
VVLGEEQPKQLCIHSGRRTSPSYAAALGMTLKLAYLP